jgi:hypothetical protein
MELECAKYGEKMDSAQAVCKHPGDYCQYRTSCMIQFITREQKESRAEAAQAEKKD